MLIVNIDYRSHLHFCAYSFVILLFKGIDGYNNNSMPHRSTNKKRKPVLGSKVAAGASVLEEFWKRQASLENQIAQGHWLASFIHINPFSHACLFIYDD